MLPRSYYSNLLASFASSQRGFGIGQSGFTPMKRSCKHYSLQCQGCSKHTSKQLGESSQRAAINTFACVWVKPTKFERNTTNIYLSTNKEHEAHTRAPIYPKPSIGKSKPSTDGRLTVSQLFSRSCRQSFIASMFNYR